MAFAITFEIDYGTSFIYAWTTDIAQDLHVSKFIRGASLVSFMGYVRVTRLVLRNSVLFEYFGRSAASTFGVTHLGGKILASCSDSDAVLLLKATTEYLSNPASAKSEYFCQSFYTVAYRYTQPLHVLFSSLRSFNNEMFADDGHKGFFVSEVLLTCTVTTTVLNIFSNNNNLFIYKSGDHRKETKHHVLIRKLRSITRIRTMFLRLSTAATLQIQPLAATIDWGMGSALLQDLLQDIMMLMRTTTARSSWHYWGCGLSRSGSGGREYRWRGRYKAGSSHSQSQ